jgi:hypothetical protein
VPNQLTIALPLARKLTEEKTENASQYSQYVQETKPLREELGILLKEELYTK